MGACSRRLCHKDTNAAISVDDISGDAGHSDVDVDVDVDDVDDDDDDDVDDDDVDDDDCRLRLLVRLCTGCCCSVILFIYKNTVIKRDMYGHMPLYFTITYKIIQNHQHLSQVMGSHAYTCEQVGVHGYFSYSLYPVDDNRLCSLVHL